MGSRSNWVLILLVPGAAGYSYFRYPVPKYEYLVPLGTQILYHRESKILSTRRHQEPILDTLTQTDLGLVWKGENQIIKRPKFQKIIET